MENIATQTRSTIMPAFRYRDARAAIDWLCNVLGCTQHALYANADNTIGHAELELGGGMIMLSSTKDDEYGKHFKSPGEIGGVETCSSYVVVTDADEVYGRALAAGAEVVRPIENMGYGSREFTVKDPEGHSWSVGTYDPWQKHA